MTTLISPSMKSHRGLDHVRLVWTLARKDIVDALKNKATLTTIVISILMVAFYRYYPSLLDRNGGLTVWVYAEGQNESVLLSALERSPGLAVRTYDSQARVLNLLSDSETPELGLVIPASADADLQVDAPVVLEGYTMRWLSAAQRTEVKSLVEEELALSLGRPVEVQLAGNEVDLHANGDFFLFSATISLAFLIVIVGISLIPNLMIEEKQAKTLDVLMVSPAQAQHVVAGKALAGMFYGLLGCGVVLIVYRYLIVQWHLAILAALVGTSFMAAIGLLLGSVVQARAQLQLIAWFVVMPLLLPVILVFMEGLVPQGAIAVMQYIPTVIVTRLFRLSFTIDAAPADYAAPLGLVLALTLALFLLLARIIRRQERV